MKKRKKKSWRERTGRVRAGRTPGRPEVVIDYDHVEALASKGLTLEQIAAAIGIAECTLHEHKNRYPELAERIRAGKAKGLAVIANAHFNAAAAGSISAQQFHLRVHGGWRDTQSLELTGKDGGPIETTDTSDARTRLIDLLSRIASRTPKGESDK